MDQVYVHYTGDCILKIELLGLFELNGFFITQKALILLESGVSFALIKPNQLKNNGFAMFISLIKNVSGF
ncbi:hypothetical protein N7532_004794 [Penicillium argentinense]|uniref:Uncharacterized protein n=1 Tax=Penicillium argentinense TaxID=1131581 RepID=A0A9W9KF80_9EURO|nr:uncharacterized protein N7532_004794 [Penicillium argentinense]KAJ5104265.1 hypothetical protein N7532_004794 [Penicillium argentinense]